MNKNMMKEIVKCTVICIAILITLTIVQFAFEAHYVRTNPASIYTVNDTIDGYIIDAVVSNNQLYAHIPNDNTVYMLTISAKNMPVLDGICSSKKQKKENYINIEKVEVSGENRQ